jgi:hypothetical protein
MRCMIRQLEERAKLPDEITLDALGAAVPHAVVKAVVAELGVAEHRRRKLPAEVGLLLSVAMNLFTQDFLDQVLVKLLKGLRFIWPDPTFVPAQQGMDGAPSRTVASYATASFRILRRNS